MDTNRIVRGIVEIGKTNIHELFENFRQAEYQKIRSTQAAVGLETIQNNVKCYDALEHRFTLICETKKFDA